MYIFRAILTHEYVYYRKITLSINSAALLNISAVTYSHIQEAATRKDIIYNVIKIPLCNVGNVC